jgi:hypothetical protein
VRRRIFYSSEPRVFEALGLRRVSEHAVAVVE